VALVDVFVAALASELLHLTVPTGEGSDAVGDTPVDCEDGTAVPLDPGLLQRGG